MDKNFSDTSYKDLKRETRLMDIFKELTFKEQFYNYYKF